MVELEEKKLAEENGATQNKEARAVIELTAESFDETLLGSSSLPWMVLFTQCVQQHTVHKHNKTQSVG